MNVIHRTNRWLPLTQTWLYNQVRFLPDHIKNTIICDSIENLQTYKVDNLYCLNASSKWIGLIENKIDFIKLQRNKRQMRRIALENNADVVHSHFGNMGWEISRLSQKLAIKHVVTFYGVDVQRLPNFDPRWYRRYRALFEKVDLVLCEGRFMAKSIQKLGCPESKIQVHHLGIDVDGIKFMTRHWVSGEPLRILIAGTFVEKKGIPYAIEAVGRIQSDIDIEVTVIGDASPNKPRSIAEKSKIMKCIEKWHMTSKVRLLGYVSHSTFIDESYKHHIFLSPSVTASDGDCEGGAPVSVIEMAATGILVISTSHCDIPEVIISGQTGLLASEKNVDDIVDHIRWLIKNCDSWQQMSKGARHRIENEYNAIVQGRRLAGMYEDLSLEKSMR